jgi:glycosyltransferase involved in cell wall biosynthesis
LRVLLSAYACEPNFGSEPGVGWNWVIGYAKKGYDVWVVTRPMHKYAIEEEMLKEQYRELRGKIKFLYHDVSFWERKRGAKGTQIHYLLWQMDITKVVYKLVRQIDFDFIHHVTFATVRQPSFLGIFKIPFIFGPVAGGENTPWRLRESYPLKGQLYDLLRDLLNKLIYIDPLMHLTFSKASLIYVTSNETLKLVPKNYRKKVRVQLAIGSEETYADGNLLLPIKNPNQEALKVLYVGNLLYLKGVHLAIKGFSQFNKKFPNSHLTIIGQGSDSPWLKDIARSCQLEQQITWKVKMNREDLFEEYRKYDVLLFPSLRDSGGMVVLEAMSKGLPVICLDLGGPGQIVDETCGIKIPTYKQKEIDIESAISLALEKFVSNNYMVNIISEGAAKKARNFLWDNVIEKSCGEYEYFLKKKKG